MALKFPASTVTLTDYAEVCLSMGPDSLAGLLKSADQPLFVSRAWCMWRSRERQRTSSATPGAHAGLLGPVLSAHQLKLSA